jgi:hypothetical protein
MTTYDDNLRAQNEHDMEALRDQHINETVASDNLQHENDAANVDSYTTEETTTIHNSLRP